eukprot:jgi/Ulvmu1/3175/UM015_0216.1
MQLRKLRRICWRHIVCAVWIALSRGCRAEAQRRECLPLPGRDAWPRNHPSWTLPSELKQTIVPADSHCNHQIRVRNITGVDVAHLPPSQALLSANGSVALPSSCCKQAMLTVKPEHKISNAFWDLVTFLESGAGTGHCDPRVRASHQCALWHPEHPQRLVAFEVHLLQVQAFRPGLHVTAAVAQNLRSAKAAAEEWQPILRERLGGAPVAIDAHDGTLIVYAQPRDLATAATALAQQPAVVHVLPRRAHFLHNLRDISLQLQAADPGVGDASAGEAQFWDAGVNGSGQVIGIGDSGLDMQHCAFADPVVPFDSFTLDGSRIPVFRSVDHRKVTLYYMFADGVDDSGGHGTHVAGILAADPLSEPGNRGLAYGAKLAFYDLGATSVQEWISAPAGLDSRYFPVTYEAGARVHSDSWGSNAVHYDADAASVDAFSHKNQDFLSVFSAGNFGSLQSTYDTTVNSPALAKNSIAVGNARPAGRSFGMPTSAAGLVGQLTFTAGGVEALTVVFVGAEFGGSWDALANPGEAIPVAVADPEEACTELTDSGAMKGALVLVQRGSCGFDEKTASAARSGARVVLVGNDKDEYVVMQSVSAAPVSLPAGLIPRSSFRYLQSLLRSGQPVAVTYAGEFDMGELDSSESMDESSSGGPTADGRIKPDLVAPGTITAAQSLTACGTSPKSGTSMAAPVIAASAALVRQYFADGFYPGGTRGQGVQHVASGPLVKAVLIGGAAHMRGFSGSKALPMASPSPLQGWGRVALAGSLPLQGGTTVDNLQIVDLAELEKEGDVDVFCLDAQQGRLVITLVWHDPPASPAAESLLVNDLDLEVRVAEFGGARLYSQGAPEPDRVNNVERVVLDPAPPGTIAISVQAHRVTTPQKYALVVQGKFSGILQHKQNPALLDQGVSDKECVVLAAEITIRPDPLTADGSPAFGFRSLTGVMPALGFECQLRSSNDATTPQWQACQSPTEYSDLADGAYTFSVRITGEHLADSSEFVVDKSPPNTEIMEDFGFSVDSPLAISLPALTSGQQVAAFAMRSTDRSKVRLTCQIDGLNAVQPLPMVNGFAVGTPYNCSTSQVFSVTAAGSFQFSVFGTDSVGNWEQDPATHAFTVSYKVGSIYTRISGPGWGASGNRSHLFTLTAIQGTADGDGTTPATPVPFQYSLGALSQADAQGGDWVDGAWTAVNGSEFTYTADGDGERRVRVRTASRGATNVVSVWRLSIDATPPKVLFRKEPPAVLLADAAIIQVAADEEGVEWECALIDGNFSVVDVELLKPCQISAEGLIEYGTAQVAGDSGGGALLDGQQYTFAVRAVDTVGNASPIQMRQFLVDLSAPQVRGMVVPKATRGKALQIEFAVTDGQAGTGVQSVECGLRWLGNSPDSETQWDPCERINAPEDGSADSCIGCAFYQYTIETAEQGIWGFSVRTRDGANQTNTTNEASTVVDRRAPDASWATAGTPRNPAPPSFAMQIEAIDQGPYKSGVRGILCALVPKGQEVSEKFQEQADADVLMPLVSWQANPDFDYADTSQQFQFGGFGIWHLCSLPARIQNVPSGSFRFDARPVDNAGNVGPTLTTIVTVVGSLAPDAALSKGGEARVMELWVIGLLVMAGVLVCAAAAGIAIWASRRRQQTPRQNGRVSSGRTHGVTVIRLPGSPEHTRAGWDDMAKQDDVRMKRALDMSMLDAGVHASRAQQRDDNALELAIQASLRSLSPR